MLKIIRIYIKVRRRFSSSQQPNQSFHCFTVVYSPPIPNHHHSLSYDDIARYPSATLISRSGNSPPTTVIYDSPSLHSWSTNDVQRYLTYPPGSISNLNEMTLLQAQSTDQSHYWPDNVNNGMIIQYMGKTKHLLFVFIIRKLIIIQMELVTIRMKHVNVLFVEQPPLHYGVMIIRDILFAIIVVSYQKVVRMLEWFVD